MAFVSGSFASTIKSLGVFRRTAFISAVTLSLLVLAILCPLYLAPDYSEATAGTVTESTLTFAFIDDKDTASVSLDVANLNGSFATSASNELAEFSLATNNATGYTLNLKTSGATTSLSDGTNSINTISGTKTADDFAVNTWGLLPSKYNGITNTTNYYPASSVGFTIEETSVANVTANIYTIGLGIKADFTKQAGIYTTASTDNGNNGASLILEYVANPVNYSITYDKGNITGTPSNIPAVQSGNIAATSIALSSAAPSITGYNFTGWCLGTVTTTDDVDSCTGTTYQPSGSFGIDQTINNSATLHAMWSIKTYALTIQSGGNTTVSGSGTYKYGQTVTITATPTSNTTCTTYSTPSWSKTSGAGTLNSASGTSVTFTIGLGDAVVTATSTATAVSQTVTLSMTDATGITIDGVSYTGASASLTCGTHAISGSYASGYEFDSWAVSGSVSVANNSSASTNLTVNGAGALTLTGKIITYRLTINFGTGIYGVMVKSGSLTGESRGLVTSSGGVVILNSTSIKYYLIPLYNSKYTFDSWSASGGTVTSDSDNYGYYYYTAKGGVTNTATISAKSLGTTSSTTMQNLSASSCTHAPSAVKDNRDNEVYYIQRLADGKCWMLENLRLGSSTSTISLTSSNTNTNGSTYTLPKAGTVCFSSSSCTGTGGATGTGYTVGAINIASKTTTKTGYGPGRNYVGTYYNYCAASAGTICAASNFSNASYDICPKGWKMPAGGSNNTAGSYYYLLNTAYKSSMKAFQYALSTPLTGYFYNGSATGQNSLGYFWATTRSTNTGMNDMYVNASSVYPASTNDRYYGYSIRCLLK